MEKVEIRTRFCIENQNSAGNRTKHIGHATALAGADQVVRPGSPPLGGSGETMSVSMACRR